ncbi:hypothetical protein A3E73_01940 [Candidatus Beckwithbacteria bacterium RIFCSPHIGHO2_12_FULL_47_17]|uniref:Uncharacterized protein n=1 Tax=Candidatus Beckwithbacteria bacterium RIFCSPHIGHO2_12_FULL_47_17 TaxID=1797460 RepID=A0A1F5DLS4_9BACT|nr:MAG: hypothetical protein A3E73_01940 [Candidatus Beckwithbacteria bacterium RIFCSPHIGHO2_12_FULL_47_17]
MFDDLVRQGWEVKEGNRDKLVPVEADGFGPCGDGRKPKDTQIKLRAPKILGGVLGKAALGSGKAAAQTIGEYDIRLACRDIKAAGFTPSVHGDTKHGKKGCGFGRLWSEGKLDNVPRLNVSLERVSEIVNEEGGQYIELDGEHEEQRVMVNFIPDMTLEPDGSCFIIDAWAADKFGINQERLLQNAVEVVVKLNGPKVIELIR